jgi:hypothetical protein
LHCRPGGIIPFMGRFKLKSAERDLFEAGTVRKSAFPTPTPLKSTAPKANTPRHVLPKDLPGAVKQLSDKDLDRLFQVVVAEQKRRGRAPSQEERSGKRRDEKTAAPLTRGTLRLVRASFKAGLTPRQIARQFGLSPFDVQKALTSEA